MIKQKLAQKVRVVLSIFVLLSFPFLYIFNYSQVQAASFSEFTIIPSRIEVSITDVNFLIKAAPVTTSTENGVRVTFATGYTVDGTPANVTVSTTGIASWDSECTNAWPGIGTAASAINGQVVDFASTDLTVATTYCFIITAGIDNPSSIGNYTSTVASRAASADVDTGAMTLPIVDDDEIVINADVGAFVRCDVTTTTGSDNTTDLGTLYYGTVSSSSDDIQIQGGTNAVEGMVWYYRNSDTYVGLRSTEGSSTLDAPDSGASGAESTISATVADCAPTTPCYGIYYNGTTSAGSGAFTADTDFTGLTVTLGAGPMRDEVYGEQIGNSGAAVCSQVTANFNVNATAGENSPAATDYTDTLIFFCKADL